ncbi:hypothetical protein GJ496_003111, partial [Pomphorhynchus laevis]
FESQTDQLPSIHYGDANGSIYSLYYKHYKVVYIEEDDDESALRFTFNSLQRGLNPYFTLHQYGKVFQYYIRELLSCSSVSGLCACSEYGSKTICFISLDLKAIKYMQDNVGVSCLATSKRDKIIFCGTCESKIVLYSPLESDRPCATLRGHIAPLCCICFDEVSNMLMSVDEKYKIIIWNVESLLKIQEIYEHELELNDALPPTILYYNQSERKLIVGRNRLSSLHHSEIYFRKRKRKAHDNKLTHIFVNSFFRSIISADNNSLVNVWDINTGQRLMAMRQSNRKVMKEVNPISLIFTAISFDESERKLITISFGNVLRIWNFNSGKLLFEAVLHKAVNKTIHAIFYKNSKLLTAGSGKTVEIFEFVSKEDIKSLSTFRVFHKATIWSMAYHGDLMATGDLLGVIILWFVDNGIPIGRYDIHSPEKASLIQTKHVSLYNQRPTNVRDRQSIGASQMIEASFAKQSNAQENSQNQAISTTDNSKPWRVVTENRTSIHRLRNGSIRNIYFLKDRRSSDFTATMVTLHNTGWIYFWSTSSIGRLLGTFHSAMHTWHVVISLAFDQHNQVLIAGDSFGYVWIWYIGEYCIDITTQESSDQGQRILKMFKRFNRSNNSEVNKRRNIEEDNRREKLSMLNEDTSSHIVYPKLLQRFFASQYNVVGVCCTPECNTIIVATENGEIHHFTLTGTLIGTFGTKLFWELSDIIASPLYHVDDLPLSHKYASANSLYVLQNGPGYYWRLVKVFFSCLQTISFVRKFLNTINQELQQSKQTTPKDLFGAFLTTNISSRSFADCSNRDSS